MPLPSSPHLHGGDSIRKHMLAVMLALSPAVFVAAYLFGWLAFYLITTCVITCLLSEAVCLKLAGRALKPVFDGSAALTGLFLALILPPYVPWWLPVLGSVAAITLGKQIYGGLGYNPFNPALSARVILLISFPLLMTTWIVPMPLQTVLNLYDPWVCLKLFVGGPEALGTTLDVITQATPLGHVKTEWSRGIGYAQALAEYHYGYTNALLGLEGGSLGETSALALLVGGVYLIARNVITWHIPISYLGSVALLASIFHSIDGNHYPPALFHLLAGGLMLCAFFMATDPVTSPVSPRAQIVFGLGCGILTWCIRTFGGYPEGAMFAVLLMNCTVPLLDQYLKPKVYGSKR